MSSSHLSKGIGRAGAAGIDLRHLFGRDPGLAGDGPRRSSIRSFLQFHTQLERPRCATQTPDQCFVCHAQPTLGRLRRIIHRAESRARARRCRRRTRCFGWCRNRFGKQNVVPVFEQQFGPIRRSSLQVQIGRHPRRGRASALGRDRHQDRSDIPSCFDCAAGPSPVNSTLETCRFGSRCRCSGSD